MPGMLSVLQITCFVSHASQAAQHASDTLRDPFLFPFERVYKMSPSDERYFILRGNMFIISERQRADPEPLVWGPSTWRS